MIFPIGDDNVKGGAFPYVTYTFIGLNVLIFIYMLTLGNALGEFYGTFATIPTEILAGKSYLTLATNMFLHGGWLHIAGNMLFLWIFADNVEAVMGNIAFLLFYLVSGIVASLAHVYFNQASGIPSLGASGALSAIMGAYLIFFPKSQVKVLVIYLFRNIYISANYFLIAWFVMQLASSFMDRSRNPDESGTAWWAHIGGFLFGLIIAWFLKKLKFVEPQKNYLKA